MFNSYRKKLPYFKSNFSVIGKTWNKTTQKDWKNKNQNYNPEQTLSTYDSLT